jgi:hypothetical protein
LKNIHGKKELHSLRKILVAASFNHKLENLCMEGLMLDEHR